MGNKTHQFSSLSKMARTVICLTIVAMYTLSTGEAFAQKTEQIQILNTDSLKFDRNRGEDLKLLYGHVIFKHDSALMYCDSAHFYSESNIFDAYSNVHIVQGDSIDIWGDSLNYNGNTEFCKLRSRVKMKDKNTVLTTNFFDYDMKKGIGTYFNRGTIVDSANTLTSDIGKYFTKTEVFHFHENVVLHNVDYDIMSDTMHYSSRTNIASFFGPTHVISKDSYIYTERGWYNTSTDVSFLNKNPWYRNKEKRLKADSILYEKKLGIGKAYKHVVITDTTQHMKIYGNYAYYREKPEYFLVVDSVMTEKVFDNDTLFMHSDTLVGYYTDTTNTDRIIKAYYKVRYFKTDLQGKCDSMVYKTKDSTIFMHNKPIIWSGKTQITGTLIRVHLRDNAVDKLFVDNMSFLVSQDDDTSRFNQVKGANMIAYFRDGSIWKLDVMRNGETVYYMRDGESLTGANKATCDNLTIFFSDSEVDEVLFKKNPVGTMYPVNQFPNQESKLLDFQWLEYIRPVDKFDIFKWRE